MLTVRTPGASGGRTINEGLPVAGPDNGSVHAR